MQTFANKFLNLKFKKRDTMKKHKKTNGHKSHHSSSEMQRSRERQDVDKAPGGERDKVKQEDLKGMETCSGVWCFGELKTIKPPEESKK